MKGIRNAGSERSVHAQGDRALEFPVSSRRDALEALRREVEVDGSGPVLLTGEPGAGKTWLWRLLVRGLAPRWRWLSVDISAALDTAEFLELVGHGLGISPGDHPVRTRLALARALEEEETEGRSWILVVENAQNLMEQVWTELDRLIHGMAAASGFASIILVGPTELARLLATRPRRTLASRLTGHVHLLPLDLDECRALIESVCGEGALDRPLVEEIHRNAAGNPRRVLQLLRGRTAGVGGPLRRACAASLKSPELLREEPDAEFHPTTDDDFSRSDRALAAAPMAGASRELPGPSLEGPLVPSRPPLRVEEGLIEVGWGGNLETDSDVGIEAEPEPAAVESVLAHGPGTCELPTEEPIEDHYAALQAWTEWARNRGRDSSSDFEPPPPHESSISPEAMAGVEAGARESPRMAGIRAESQHEHAPYSQLFSRLRQSK
jgi:general secretion pathway protein A